MRVCLMVEGQESVSRADWLAPAGACERGGLEGLFRLDHYTSVFGAADHGSHLAEGWIAGATDEVAEQLHELEQAGVERFFLQHLDHSDVDTVELIGRSFA